MNQSPPETNGNINEWRSKVGATPVSTSFLIDNRSKDEKSAQARLIIAEAEEKEQKNLLRKLKIGTTYFCYFTTAIIIGFIFGYTFYYGFVCDR